MLCLVASKIAEAVSCPLFRWAHDKDTKGGLVQRIVVLVTVGKLGGVCVCVCINPAAGLAYL